MEQQDREVALGYHSPTEWVFLPHVVGLYDSFIINVDVFERALEKAAESPSDYENRKGEILRLLADEGKLKPQKYEVPDTARAQLGSLVDFFFDRYPEELRGLVAGAFRAFREHELGTVRQLMHPDDPHAQHVIAKVPEWERTENEIRNGKSLDDIPFLKQSITGYFEDCLFSPLLFPTAYNPLFSWEGYAPFEEWLLSRRQDVVVADERIRRGSESMVIQALCESAIPFAPVRTQEEISRILKLWDGFSAVRDLAASHNAAIWKEIDRAREAAGSDRMAEFVRDFERFLELRANALSREISDVSLEIEKSKQALTYKLTRFIIATVGSLAPGCAGLQDLLMQLHDGFIEKRVVQRHPDVAALIEYERNMKNTVLQRAAFSPVCRTNVEYEPQQYWDA